MHKLETLREAAEMIEDKIVSMCFESDPQVFVQWLRMDFNLPWINGES